uniref:PH domain-containing protein n=1 Tax=Mycena chlorophos TaxID=658473 RepID=A0ABQ0LTT1_MYCCL|nr:predicted protein [Mycena chlorophos]
MHDSPHAEFAAWMMELSTSLLSSRQQRPTHTLHSRQPFQRLCSLGVSTIAFVDLASLDSRSFTRLRSQVLASAVEARFERRRTRPGFWFGDSCTCVPAPSIPAHGATFRQQGREATGVDFKPPPSPALDESLRLIHLLAPVFPLFSARHPLELGAHALWLTFTHQPMHVFLRAHYPQTMLVQVVAASPRTPGWRIFTHRVCAATVQPFCPRGERQNSVDQEWRRPERTRAVGDIVHDGFKVHPKCTFEGKKYSLLRPGFCPAASGEPPGLKSTWAAALCRRCRHPHIEVLVAQRPALAITRNTSGLIRSQVRSLGPGSDRAACPIRRRLQAVSKFLPRGERHVPSDFTAASAPVTNEPSTSLISHPVRRIATAITAIKHI